MSAPLPLVPPSSGPVTVALDRSGARIEQADVGVIARVRNAEQVPAHLLPQLAWHKGVDLWFEDWPESRKRRITGEIVRLKGAKGSLAGLQGYLAYVDAAVIDAVLPPQDVVARAQDADRLRRYRARFAELRITPFAVRDRRAGTIASSGLGSPTAVVDRAAARPDARLHYGRRATIVDGGVETVIRSQDQTRSTARGIATPVTVLAIPGRARATESLPGHVRAGSMVAHASTRGRLLTLAGDSITFGGIADGVSDTAVLDAAPERVTEDHPGLCSDPVARVSGSRSVPGRMVAHASRADRFIYDRWTLFDRDRAEPGHVQAVGPTVGRMVARLTPYTALLRIDARFRLSGRSAKAGCATVGRAVARAPSDRIDRVGLAIHRAKALRDEIRFTTRTHRPIAVGDLSFERSIPWTGMVPITTRTA